MREEHTEQSMLKNQRSFQNVDETIEKMIKHNTVLDSERIYHIAMSDPYEGILIVKNIVRSRTIN